jgi:nitrogen regulatory protein PII
MKRIEAVVRPDKLEAVKESLVGCTPHRPRSKDTASKGITQQWRGEEYVIDCRPR